MDGSTEARLMAYEKLLREEALPQGLISPGDESRLRERHIDDSLRGAACVGEERGRVADLGSGAGLPGIPIAIVRPDVAVHLVESRSRRVAFMELAVERLGLTNVTVIGSRAENLRARFDVCLTRAVTGAADGWELAAPLLGPQGKLLYWAGRSWLGQAGSPVAGVSYEICAPSRFPWQGPVVMMMRSRTDPTSERRD